MKIGLSTAAYYGKFETEDAAEHIRRRFDLDCVEVFLETGSEYSAQFASTVKARLDGLPVTSVHPMDTSYENSLFGRSPRQRADAMALVRGVLDAAQTLGAGIYVYHGNHSAKGTPIEPNFVRYRDGLTQMCREAKQRGVRICWENVWWCVMSTPERAEMVRDLYPDIGFVLDVKQAMQGGHDAKAFIPVMGKRLMNIHVVDYDERGRLCLPGQGTYDFRRFFAALRDVGYDGPVILEPYATMFERDEELEAAIAYLRAAMAG